jgi:hypothetical protein
MTKCEYQQEDKNMTDFYFLSNGSKFPLCPSSEDPDYSHTRSLKLSFLLTLNVEGLTTDKLWNSEALRKLAMDLVHTTADKKRLSKAEIISSLSKLQDSERRARLSNYALISEKYDAVDLSDLSLTPEAVLLLLTSPDNSPEEVAKLAEVCLREKYSNITTLTKRAAPGFKMMVKNHTLAPSIPVDKLKNFLDSLSTLLLPETIQVNKEYKTSVWDRQSTGRTEIFPASMHQFHLDTLRNLDKVSVREITVALAYATGRRMGEIRGDHSEFTEVSDNHVMFKGQLKTKGRSSAPYVIPTLLPARLVVGGHNKLREMGVLHPPSVVNARLASGFSTGLPDELRALWTRAGISKFKDNRNAYATVLVNQLDPSLTPAVLLNKVLGHSDQDIQTGLTYLAFWTRDHYTPDGPVGFIDIPDVNRFPRTPEYTWADFDREHNHLTTSS